MFSRLIHALTVSILVLLPAHVLAQPQFPSKPIRLVVPFSPCGTSDILGRMISLKMNESWTQPVVLETRTGAGGTIGTSIVAKATAAGIKVVHVGFKGASDAMIEVLAERVHYAILGLAGALPFIKDGKLLALAVGTPQRSPLLPDVPTIAETLPGYLRDGSHSLLAPAGTPRPVLNQISRDVQRVFELPDIKERLRNFDFVAALTTPEEHDKILRADIATFSGVVKLARLRPQ